MRLQCQPWQLLLCWRRLSLYRDALMYLSRTCSTTGAVPLPATRTYRAAQPLCFCSETTRHLLAATQYVMTGRPGVCIACNAG